MQKVQKIIILTLSVIALFAVVYAQMAPRETVSATVGGRKVSVEYCRPSLKGRSFDELIQKLQIL